MEIKTKKAKIEVKAEWQKATRVKREMFDDDKFSSLFTFAFLVFTSNTLRGLSPNFVVGKAQTFPRTNKLI